MYAKVGSLLTELLTLKFGEINEQFFLNIEKVPLDIFIKESQTCIKVIQDNQIKTDINTKAVSIILPLNEQGSPYIDKNWLRASACFPWELDRVKDDLWLTICQQEHILAQLAQSAFYGSPIASKFLRVIARQCNLHDQHPYWDDREFPAFQVFRFPIDPGFRIENLEAPSYDLFELDEEEATKIFLNILLMEMHGVFQWSVDAQNLMKGLQASLEATKASNLEHNVEVKQSIPKKESAKKSYQLDKISLLKIDKLNNLDKIFKILIYGDNSKDKTLMDLIKRNLTDSSTPIEGTNTTRSYKLGDKTVKLKFTFLGKNLKNAEQQDGIIIADPQSRPEETAKELKKLLKAKSFLFYGTNRPNPAGPYSFNFYLSQKDASLKQGDEVFEKFVREMIRHLWSWKTK